MGKTEKLFTKNFTFLMLGQIFSLIGNYTLKFALSMYVLEQTGSASVFGTLLAIATVPAVILGPFGGVMADRLNRRNMMVALDFLSGTAVLAAFLLMGENMSMFLVGALQIVLAVLGAFESPVVQACVPQMQSGENLLKGNAAVNQVQALAGLVTPFTGSLFYAAFGIRPVLFGAAVCFFLTAFLERFIQLPCRKRGNEEKEGIWNMICADFGDSGRFLLREEPQVLKLLLLAALASFFVVGTAIVGLPYLVRTVLGLSAEHYGAAESAMGAAAVAGGILSGVLAGRLQMGRLYRLLIFTGICLLPAGMMFLLPVNAFGRYLVVLLCFCAVQAAATVFSVMSLSMIQERTPAELTGKIMAFVITFSACAQPLGQLIYGLLFDAFTQAVWVVLAVTGLAVICLGVSFRGLFLSFHKSQG